MTRHLAACSARAAAEAAGAGPGAKPARLLTLLVEGRDSPEYWMHLAVPETATLDDLDTFLRQIWLECCGHLSDFTIRGTRYVSGGEDEPWGRALPTTARVGGVLAPGVTGEYQYDFGSTTHLKLQGVEARPGHARGKSITILARNEPLEIPCQECGKPATRICTECSWSGEGWLCDACAEEHECGEEMQLPVVNSPRVGVCGYTGDADWE
jgi:hypothetical protein